MSRAFIVMIRVSAPLVLEDNIEPVARAGHARKAFEACRGGEDTARRGCRAAPTMAPVSVRVLERSDNPVIDPAVTDHEVGHRAVRTARVALEEDR